jgi:putative hydrolase of the HAD superfamily
MIRAVAFDLWETLITDTPEISRAQERLRLTRMEEVLARRGLGAAANEIELAYRRLWSRCHDLYWSRDTDVPCRTQIVHFFEAMEVDASAIDEATLTALEDAYANAAVDALPAVVPGAHDVLRRIKERGYGVGLISNTGRTPGSALREILQRTGLAASIDAMVFSNEHGECKPRASIFESLRQALGVGFDQMLFVGDNPYVDVFGAQRCGMFGVHFDPPQRGSAVAPPFDHGEEIVPDATVSDLRDLPAIIDRLSEGALEPRGGAALPNN